MNRIPSSIKHPHHATSGVVLVEMMLSLTIGIIILGVLTFASIGMSRSLSATDRYITGVANENRLMDYVAADLRRAVRVSLLSGSTTTTLKDTGSTSYSITDTAILSINIPDYYASNTPNNATASTFKTSRYTRASLNSSSSYNGNSNSWLNGVVPWGQAQIAVGSKRVTRFAPSSAGTGELEVRYYRGVRSTSDSTPCFFRSEYPSGATTPSATVEIAERISDDLSTTTMLISARNSGQVFNLQSSFTPTYRRQGASTVASTGILEVSIRNLRRD